MLFSGTSKDFLAKLTTLPAETRMAAAANWREWQHLTMTSVRSTLKSQQLQEQFEAFAKRIQLLSLSGAGDLYICKIDNKHRGIATKFEDNSGKPRLIWFAVGTRKEMEDLTTVRKRPSLIAAANAAVETHRRKHKRWYQQRSTSPAPTLPISNRPLAAATYRIR